MADFGSAGWGFESLRGHLVKTQKTGLISIIKIPERQVRFITINYENRTYGLDVFRAIAILIVVKGHGGLVLGNFFDGFPSIPLPDGVEFERVCVFGLTIVVPKLCG